MSSDKKSTASVEELYIKEKKKSSILLLSTIVFGVLFVGSMVYGLNAKNSSPSSVANVQNGQQQAGPAGRGRQSVTEFFDESGTVDQEAVSAFYIRASQGGPQGADSSQFIERFTQQIESAVESGEITQTQGDKLKEALSQAASAEMQL